MMKNKQQEHRNAEPLMRRLTDEVICHQQKQQNDHCEIRRNSQDKLRLHAALR